MNLQHILFFLAFLTFGIGDALTATIMMNVKGSDAEFNDMFGYLYESSGASCFIAVKLALVIIVLFLVYLLSKKAGYWLICGWLSALIIGGIMAMISNLGSAYGIFSVNPWTVIMCYLVLTCVFLYAGDRKDTKTRNIK